VAAPSRRQRTAWKSAARSDPEVEAALARLGERVRSVRRDLGWTQEAAANAAGIDPKHLQDIEAGNVNVTFATLSGLARAYKVSLAELFDGV